MYPHKNSLILKKIEREDLIWMKELKDESWFGTHRVSVLNMEDQCKWFDRIQCDDSTLVLKVLRGAEIIGLFKIFSIDSVSRMCDVGWDLVRDHRGKQNGKSLVEVGTDFCFEMLNMNRLNAEILSNNVASQKCAEFNCYVREGCKRKAVYRCGCFLDSYLYGIIRDDWEKKLEGNEGVCNRVFKK